MLDAANEFATSAATNVFLPFQLSNGHNSLESNSNWAYEVFFDMFCFDGCWKQCRILFTISKIGCPNSVLVIELIIPNK